MTSDTAANVDEGPSTFRLLFLVLTVSFGTWFPLGYAMGIINASQREIILWIRHVKCHRLPSLLNPDILVRNGIICHNITAYEPSNDYALWCGNIAPQHENKLLSENTELNTIWALVASILPIGSFMVVWGVKSLLSRFGNKKTLLMSNAVGILGAILCGISGLVDTYELLILGRVLLGMNVGIIIAVVPLYMAEISPSNLRGALGTVPGLSLVTGTLVGIVLGLPQFLGNAAGWPILSLLLLVPFGLLFLSLPFCPESPRYLLLVQRDENAARKALIWLRCKKDVLDELDMIRQEGNVQKGSSASLSDLFSNKIVRSALLICIALLLGQQLSGICAIILYSNSIFISAGLEVEEALYGTVGLFCLQIVAVVASLLLADRAGRKILLLTGLIGSMITSIGMLIFMSLGKQGEEYYWAQYGCMACIVVFVVVFNLGPAFVPWILISEMFDQRHGSSAITVCSAVSHAAGLGVGFAFPILQAHMEEWVFAGFAACSAFFAVFAYFKVIETKGKTFDEIQIEMRKQLR